MRYNDPEALWKKNNKPVNKEETDRNFYADIKSLDQNEKIIVDRLPDQFKNKPIAKRSYTLQDNSKTSFPVRLRGGHKVVFHLQNESPVSINLGAGLIKARQYKTLRLEIYPYNNELLTAGKTALLSKVIQPKQPIISISLNSLKPGTYIAVLDDARNGFKMSFTGDVSFAIVAASQNRVWSFGRNNLVFAVSGVKEFQIKNDGVLTLVSPKGRIIDLQKQKGFFTIQVQNGEEGIWKVQRQNGKFHIQGLLPFVNTDQEFLLRYEE